MREEDPDAPFLERLHDWLRVEFETIAEDLPDPKPVAELMVQSLAFEVGAYAEIAVRCGATRKEVAEMVKQWSAKGTRAACPVGVVH